MHRAYRSDIASVKVVASGLKDTMGLYSQPNDEENETCRKWMDIFGIKDLADRTFLKAVQRRTTPGLAYTSLR